MLSLDTTTAVQAAQALGDLASNENAGPLEKILEGWFVAPDTRAVVAIAADRCGSTAGMPALKKLLSSFRSTNRMCVYRAVSMRPLPGMVGALEEMLAKAGPMEASSIIDALTSLGKREPREVRAAIERSLPKLDEDLALEAREMLAGMEANGDDVL